MSQLPASVASSDLAEPGYQGELSDGQGTEGPDTATPPSEAERAEVERAEVDRVEVERVEVDRGIEVERVEVEEADGAALGPSTDPATAPSTGPTAAPPTGPTTGPPTGPTTAVEAEREDMATPASGRPGGGEEPKRLGQLEREGEVAADFLEKLLDIADLDGDIDVDIDGDRAAVSVVDSEEGRVPRRLVGPDAKVLDALQELTRLAVQAVTGERSRLMLDVAGHRAARRAALVGIAREAVTRVKQTGERAAMEPMTAFERKVVHDEVLASGLTSESEGVEPVRHVIVLPA